MDTRPLPPGWVSQWEPSAGRYFFVNTTKNPPESTWDDPRDAPPPYSASMPTPETYQSYSTSSTYPQYSQDPQYPPSLPSDSKAPNAYPGYPSGQPQPDSYNPYNKYDSTATSSTAPKKNGLLSKFGLSSGKHGKASKPNKPNKPNNYNNYTPPAASYVPPALGTAAALGALSHHKPGKKKHGLGIGSGVGLGLGGAAAGLLVGNALFGGFGGCDSDWGGCDW